MDDFKNNMRLKYKQDLNRDNFNRFQFKKKQMRMGEQRDQHHARMNMEYRNKLQTMREKNRRDFYRKQYFEEKRKQAILKGFEYDAGVVCPDQINDPSFRPLNYDSSQFLKNPMIKNPRTIAKIHQSAQINGRKTYRKTSFARQNKTLIDKTES